jgi:hypothetical protein
LSIKEEPLEDRHVLKLDDIIKENEEEEGFILKNMPNATNQKEQSPFK